MAKDINRSETLVVKRSQINMNPCNIKNHSDEQIKLQVKNIRKVGLLGGMVWNRRTGNLVDGHKRLMSVDLIQKYDGTPNTDYDIKVEVVEMDEREEKNQLSFMAMANSKVDYALVANIIEDIDYKEIGISDEEYNQILDLRDYETDNDDLGEIETIEDAFAPKQATETEETEKVREKTEPQAQRREAVTVLPKVEETNAEFQSRLDAQPHMTKEEVKAQKEHVRNEGEKLLDNADRYVVLDFKTQAQKEAFCEVLGIRCTPNMVIDPQVIIEALDIE